VVARLKEKINYHAISETHLLFNTISFESISDFFRT
jgi:hypothetical protein